MSSTRETVAAVIATLRESGVQCDLFGGWAEEVLGIREPWPHGDLNLLYRGDSFGSALKILNKEALEVPLKRFRHKRDFRFRETLCEVTLVRGADEQPVTLYWGDVPFYWERPLLHDSPITVCGEVLSIVSTANLRRHRLCHKAAARILGAVLRPARALTMGSTRSNRRIIDSPFLRGCGHSFERHSRIMLQGEELLQTYFIGE